MNKTKPVQDSVSYRRMQKACTRRGAVYGLMWEIGCLTGFRISDILRFRVCDMTYPVFRFTEKKTGHVREVKIPTPLCSVIKRHISRFNLKPYDYIIFSRTKGKRAPVSRQQAYNVIRSAASELNLKDIGTHSMRKTYAYNKFSETKSLKALQSDFGHKYPSTTLVHYLDSFLDFDVFG